jgi:hypothetical protein
MSVYMRVLPQLFVNYDTEMPSNGHNNFRECALIFPMRNKGNNKITELRTILQRESQNS